MSPRDELIERVTGVLTHPTNRYRPPREVARLVLDQVLVGVEERAKAGEWGYIGMGVLVEVVEKLREDPTP